MRFFFIMQGLITLLMLSTDNVFQLINYTQFVESFFWGVSVAGLLYLRYKEPNRERPIKVSKHPVWESSNYFKRDFYTLSDFPGQQFNSNWFFHHMLIFGGFTYYWWSSTGWSCIRHHGIRSSYLYFLYSLEEQACVVEKYSTYMGCSSTKSFLSYTHWVINTTFPT